MEVQQREQSCPSLGRGLKPHMLPGDTTWGQGLGEGGTRDLAVLVLGEKHKQPHRKHHGLMATEAHGGQARGLGPTVVLDTSRQQHAVDGAGRPSSWAQVSALGCSGSCLQGLGPHTCMLTMLRWENQKKSRA